MCQKVLHRPGHRFCPVHAGKISGTWDIILIFSFSSAFLCIICCSLRAPFKCGSWHIWTYCLLFLFIRYNSQACGVPGRKHSKAWPPLQSLQDEPPPQMWEWSGTAALYGKTGEMHHTELCKTSRRDTALCICLLADTLRDSELQECNYWCH